MLKTITTEYILGGNFMNMSLEEKMEDFRKNTTQHIVITSNGLHTGTTVSHACESLFSKRAPWDKEEEQLQMMKEVMDNPTSGMIVYLSQKYENVENDILNEKPFVDIPFSELEEFAPYFKKYPDAAEKDKSFSSVTSEIAIDISGKVNDGLDIGDYADQLNMFFIIAQRTQNEDVLQRLSNMPGMDPTDICLAAVEKGFSIGRTTDIVFIAKDIESLELKYNQFKEKMQALEKETTRSDQIEIITKEDLNSKLNAGIEEEELKFER